MKIYEVTIGTKTRKGLNPLVRKVIQTEADTYSVDKYFQKRYEGFEVEVKGIEAMSKNAIKQLDELEF